MGQRCMNWSAEVATGLLCCCLCMAPYLAYGQGEEAPSSALHEAQQLVQESKTLLNKQQRIEALQKAEAAVQRAKSFRQNSPEYAEALTTKAIVCITLKKDDCAENALVQAEKIYAALGPGENRGLADFLNTSATFSYYKGKYHRASQLYEEALQHLQGASLLDRARVLNHLGMVSRILRDYQRAQLLLKEAAGIQLAAAHPDAADTLYNLALLYLDTGAVAQALTSLTQATTLEEPELTRFLSHGEEEISNYMGRISSDIDAAVSLHVRSAPNNPEALRLALTTVLNRKGRVLDALVNSSATWRRHLTPESETVRLELAQAQAQLAALQLEKVKKRETASNHTNEIALGIQLRALNEKLRALNVANPAQEKPLTIEEVRTAIPLGAVLVEIMEYHPFRPQVEKPAHRWGPRRYVAYLLFPQGQLSWVDLGEAEPIDQAAAKFGRAISRADRDEADIKALARTVDDLLMRPIRQRLGEAQMVLVSPDGPLHLLPFEALVDEDGRYLLETFTFVYLTTGRDLVRLREHPPVRDEPVIVANPAFDSAGVTQVARNTWEPQDATVRRSSNVADFVYSPLPGSFDEAKAVKQLLPEATLLLGPQATKAALQELHGPRILHLATHGFFLKDHQEEMLAPDNNLKLRPVREQQQPGAVERASSLLYSGLALAGANQPEGGIEHGLLTAFEAAALDLWGTKLVILSACETGVGDVHRREGVYGLRRAMMIAGAESQVTSLWKVDDAATQGLMIDYYTRLLSGAGRAEGLRQAQLAMLQSTDPWRSTTYWITILKQLLFGKDRAQAFRRARLTLKRGTGWWRHPYYWAGFIASGDWRSLSEDEDNAATINSWKGKQQ